MAETDDVRTSNNGLAIDDSVELGAVEVIIFFFCPRPIYPIFQKIYLNFKSNCEYVCASSKSFLGGPSMIEKYIRTALATNRQCVCKRHFQILKFES